jgi:3-oxoacyl-[acyl-carrier protein] reductase
VVLNVGTGAGTSGPQPGAEEWRRLFDANLWSSVHLAEAALPSLTGAGSGAIVLIGSIAGLEDVGAPMPYAVAKAAVAAYTRTLARRLGETGVRVNCVAPGNVLHEGSTWERRLAADREAVEAMLEREVPLRRLGRPEEIAKVVVFLCSAAASFVTGAIVAADGGQMRGW